LDLILNNKKSELKADDKSSRPNILIIDEVDVFFNDSFYGQVYRPMARLKDPVISSLIKYLWSRRN
jgi:hypothetical protein